MKAFFQILVFLPSVLLAPSVPAQPVGPQAVISRYQALRAAASTQPRPLPFYVESSERNGALSADVYAAVSQPFADMSPLLAMPATWCYFIPISLNIKACTQHRQDGAAYLTLYGGRDFYESPEDAYQVQYRFQPEVVRKDYLRLRLSAAHGPLGTKNYLIVLDMLPYEGQTLVHIHTSYRTGLLSRIATRLYLATLGRNRVGFSITGYDSDGKPIFIKGMAGIIERNALRYFLALHAYLDTRAVPAAERYDAMLRVWFGFTERYPKQLHEMDWPKYFQAKQHEHANQLELQKQIDAGHMPTASFFDDDSE